MNKYLFYCLSGIIIAVCAYRGFIARTDFPFDQYADRDIVATVCNRPMRTYDSLLVDVCFDSYKVLLRFGQYSSHATVSRADKILISSNVQPFEPFTTETGTVVRYDRLMLSRGYDGFQNDPQITVIESRTSLLEYLDHIFEYCLRAIIQTVPYPASSLTAGVLLGDQSGFSDDDKDMFRRAGLSHIIVLSGFNITIISVIISQLLMRYGRGFSVVMTIVMTIAFMIVVGPTQSLMRAALMTLIILLVRYYGLGSYVMRALILALVIIAGINPVALVWDISLHLSFLATWGLLVMATPLSEKVFFWVTDIFELRSSLSATIAATIAVLPISIFQFRYVSPVAIPINVVVLPLVTPLMAMGLGVIVLRAISDMFGVGSHIIASLAGIPAWIIAEYVFWIARIGTNLL